MADKKSTSKKNTAKDTTKKVAPKTAQAKTTKPATKKAAPKTSAKKVQPEVKKAKPEVKKVQPVVKKVETPVVEKKVEPKVKNENNFSDFVKTNSRNLILGAICILLIINIVIISLGHQVKLTDGKEVVASIDGKKYTAEDLFGSLKKQYGSNALVSLIDSHISDKELNDEEIKKAKEQANEYVASIKAQYESAGYEWDTVLKQYGYTNEDDLVKEYLGSVKTELVAKKYVEKDLTEKELNDYYEKNIYGNYTVKHILVKPVTDSNMTDEQKTAAEETAKAKASEVISKYVAGEDWAGLVAAYSEDEGSKENEGLVENFTNGDMEEEFFKATVALKDGEYTTSPIKTSYGYHVILRVSATAKPSLKDSKNDVVKAIIDEKLKNDNSLYTKTWVKIRKKYNLSINDTTIKNAYKKAISE